MPQSFRSLACILFLFGSAIACGGAVTPLPMLTTNGKNLVDPAGHQVILKGCNLGNYLMLESWMFSGTLTVDGQPFHDGMQIYRTLTRRFGQPRAEAMLKTYRDSWITPRDFEQIKSFGFNVVRLPFDYRQLQSDDAPFVIKPDAFQWIDQTLAMAQTAGVYVILDLHGVPGGQSNEDHTGEAGQNKFWSSDENQQRTIDLWHAIAERYKDRSTVAGYDLINEPYSDHRTDVRPQLAAVMPKIYDAIRSTGDQHILYFPAGLNTGIRFYGDPHARNMTNVGFTEHYYPGLFGSKSAIETQARLITQTLPAKAEYAARLGVPYYVGEFNVVQQSEESDRMMREYFDHFANYGWTSTMWSYKLLKTEAGSHPSAWYMVTNADPIAPVDLATATDDQITAVFTGMATMPLATNEPLRQSLTMPALTPLYLTAYPTLPTLAPTTAQSNPEGYSSVDIGGSLAGHTKTLPDGRVVVLGGGDDINGTADSCRFVSTTTKTAAIDVRATITSFVDTQEFAKAGAMARWGDSSEAAKPDAAMAMLNVFPDGTIAFISRTDAGGRTSETKIATGATLPIELRLNIDSGQVTASYRTVGSEWLPAGKSVIHPDGPVQTGLAVCAHVDNVLTTVKAYLGDQADRAVNNSPTPSAAGSSLLQNGSFEQQGDSSDRAADWNRWGDWINRETAWAPTHSGSCVIGYHHWQITTADSSGIWQEVSVETGKQYTFSIYAQHDVVPADQHDASTVELRMECTTADGQVTVNSQNFDVANLATGNAWTRLSVSGTTQSDKLRVMAVINSAADMPRGGSVKLDDAALALTNSLTTHASADRADSSDETAIPSDAVTYRDLEYVTRSTGPEKLDLYLPPGDGPFPLILWFHGGAWMMGDKAAWPHMNYLVSHGYAVANVEYRFSQVAPFPAQLDDCAAALDFLVGHASDYHLNPNRIAATGESAGGNLASLLGMTRPAAAQPTSAGQIRAVIDLFGPTDLLSLEKSSLRVHKVIDQLLGGPIETSQDLATAASPLSHVAKTNPPFLIFHGTADPQVPFAQSRQLTDALLAAGVPVNFVPVKGAGHASPAFWTPEMRDKMLKFLSRAMPADAVR